VRATWRRRHLGISAPQSGHVRHSASRGLPWRGTGSVGRLTISHRTNDDRRVGRLFSRRTHNGPGGPLAVKDRTTHNRPVCWYSPHLRAPIGGTSEGPAVAGLAALPRPPGASAWAGLLAGGRGGGRGALLQRWSTRSSRRPPGTPIPVLAGRRASAAGRAAACSYLRSRPCVRPAMVRRSVSSGERRREVDSFRRWHFRSYPPRAVNPGSAQVSMSNRASMSWSNVIPRRCARTRSSSEWPHRSCAHSHADPANA